MLTFFGTPKALDSLPQSQLAGDMLALHSPVQFDPTLVGRLVAAHEALNARFAQLVCLLDSDPVAAASTAQECAHQLHQLRRTESIWLYPVIAFGIDADPEARRQLMQLRMVLLSLARGTLRLFDDLSQALRNGVQSRVAADRVSLPLAEYLSRSAFEVYPLYSLVGLRQVVAAPRADRRVRSL